jgi:ankyrin repeat protein
MHMAASLGFIDIMDVLARGGANVNAVDEKSETPLHHAVRAGQSLAVEKLLQLPGVTPEPVGPDGQTPLHFLCQYPKDNAIKILQVLLPHVPNINLGDAQGNTALFYACSSKAGKLAQALISMAGAHLATPNKNGATALTTSIDLWHTLPA